MNFTDPDLLNRLETSSPEAWDAADFGLVVMDQSGKVTGYNRTEAGISGLSPDRVIGRHFFTAVAPCTNNFMVAQRFEDEPELDSTIDYVFTLRMRPTKVRLRLLKSQQAQSMYLVVERI